MAKKRGSGQDNRLYITLYIYILYISLSIYIYVRIRVYVGFSFFIFVRVQSICTQVWFASAPTRTCLDVFVACVYYCVRTYMNASAVCTDAHKHMYECLFVVCVCVMCFSVRCSRVCEDVCTAPGPISNAPYYSPVCPG